MSATHTRFLILPILFSALVFADLVPIIPRPGDSFSAFSECTIGWEADTSGTWKNITIELMTGSNTNAIPLMNVISGLDGTDPEKNRYSWICPDVDPNSNIYFYQFTNGADIKGSKWTARFTIASPYGSSVPPEHPTQSNGEPVPWGTGHLVSRHRNHEQDEEQGITSEDSGDGPINGHDATLITRSSGDPNSQRSQTQASRETESLHQNSSTVDIRATGTSDRPQTVATPIPLPSPIALPAPARKGQLTASGSSSHVVSPPTQPSDPGILLKSMQLTSGTVKINVGLNIVPSILVALFILF